METKAKERNIGFEVMRIVSMLLIILLHSIDHSGAYENLAAGSALYYIEHFFYAAVQVCVNCFILISGYFLVTSEFKPKKLISLWFEVVFYSAAIKIILMLFGEIEFSVTSLASCFVPILTGRYWFITIYFGMYLLSPFFNIAINAMNKKQHRLLIIILFVLFSCMVSIHPSLKGMSSNGGWGLAWFTVLYFTAAYFRLHYEPSGKTFPALAAFFVCPLFMIAALWVSNFSGSTMLKAIVENWFRYDSIFAVIASVALLIVFVNSKIKCGKGMKKILVSLSASTFAVYLIHAHANICTPEMWQRIGMVKFMSNWWYPLYQLAVVIMIFAACVIIDKARIALFKLIKLDKLAETMGNGISRLIGRFTAQ